MTETLRQPDATTCGASVAVLARRLIGGASAATLAGDAASGFGAEEFGRRVVATHVRLTSRRDAIGRPQLPWPRALGTPPWALAREMSLLTGRRHRVAFVRDRRRHLERLRAEASPASPVPAYVGNRWLPRHVVLVLGPTDAGLSVYDPAAGFPVEITADDWTAATMHVGGWPRPWLVVVPTAG